MVKLFRGALVYYKDDSSKKPYVVYDVKGDEVSLSLTEYPDVEQDFYTPQSKVALFSKEEFPKALKKINAMTGVKEPMPQIRDVMTDDEAEARYKYELAHDMINTIDTPHYDSLNEFKQMLRDMGVKIVSVSSHLPLKMTKVPKLGSKGSGWHKEPISHSYATKFGKAPKHVRGR